MLPVVQLEKVTAQSVIMLEGEADYLAIQETYRAPSIRIVSASANPTLNRSS
ncbi:hypothetical protein [Sphingomonas sp. DBB INV C78]|uniref:hypothetical protein n=1 Tax=Sphingomonas sp. DBB INV C78 TaxID=3349434 RepID=UPI0036D3623E